ncbi:MAG: hypothetical protein AAGL69_03515 [Pseudomonadota bacterium]
MMWKYSIVVEGTGIHVKSDEKPMIGFYANRKLWTSSAEAAIDKAKALILEDWMHGGYRDANTGSAPMLRVESITPVSLVWLLLTPSQKSGYVFYPDTDS